MIDAPPLLAPLVDGLKAPFSRPFETSRSQPAKGWTLVVAKDRFTGQIDCTIRARALTYRNGVLTFRFGHSVDTANALFRVEGGPARSVGEVAVEAAGQGASFLTANTRNPSNGEVRLPLSEVEGRRSVAIRPNLHAPVRTFSLDGFGAALAAAAGKSCPVR